MNFKDFLPKILPFSKQDETQEFFFGLNVTPDQVLASVWGVRGKKIVIVSQASKKYKDDDDLIEKANFALDEALADFQPEPEKILFNVPDSWLQDDDLKPQSAKLLKRMIDELGVSPMAYVSTTHAVCHLLQKHQGVPVTAVMVEVNDPLSVSVVKAGKIIATKEQKRTGDLPQDIEKALLSIPNVEVLPSKIVIYGSEYLPKYKEEMLSYSWMAQLPFLHLPKIEELEENFLLKATCFAGASELFSEVNFHPSDIGVMDEGEVRSGVTRRIDDDRSHSNLRGVPEEAANLGFVAGDITDEGDKYLDNEIYEEERTSNISVMPQSNTRVASAGVMGKIKDAFSAPMSFFAKFSKGGNLWIKVAIVLIVLVVIFGGSTYFLHKATVTVFIDLRTLENDSQIIADPALKEIDEANKRIPGQIVDIQETGSGKAQATGKKQIGDPAKGTVVLYNKTSSSKSFSQGTKLTGSGNLVFTLDTAVNIASQSAVDGGIAFGKANVNATATTIGPDGNLAAGQELQVSGFSSGEVSAKVDSAFSGGVSKDVTVITTDDQNKLLAQVIAELRLKAKDDIQTKLTGDMKVLEESLTEQVIKKTFSKNVGDQASELSLNLTASFKGTAYNQNDLRTIVSKLVQTNVPEGYAIDLSKTETQANVARIEKDGKLIFNAKFKAKLMPNLVTDQIKQDIVGMTPEEAAVKLRTIENVIGSDISITPSMPASIQRLPFFAKNITLEVTAK